METMNKPPEQPHHPQQQQPQQQQAHPKSILSPFYAVQHRSETPPELHTTFRAVNGSFLQRISSSDGSSQNSTHNPPSFTMPNARPVAESREPNEPSGVHAPSSNPGQSARSAFQQASHNPNDNDHSSASTSAASSDEEFDYPVWTQRTLRSSLASLHASKSAQLKSHTSAALTSRTSVHSIPAFGRGSALCARFSQELPSLGLQMRPSPNTSSQSSQVLPPLPRSLSIRHPSLPAMMESSHSPPSDPQSWQQLQKQEVEDDWDTNLEAQPGRRQRYCEEIRAGKVGVQSVGRE